MQHKFFSNIIFLVILNLLVKPFWVFGIDRTVQNSVGTENYGFYFALFNFTFLFNIFLDAGINNFNNRNIAQNRQLLTKHFSGIVLLRCLLAVIYFIIVFVAGYFIGYGREQYAWMGLLCLNQFLLSFVFYIRTNISGLQLFRYDSMVSVLDRLLMILFCGLLLWGNITEAPFKIEWFIVVQTLSYSLTACVAFFILAPHIRYFIPKWDFPFFLMILKQSFPYALLILLMSVYTRADAVMLERLLPDGKTFSGIYAQAYRLLDAACMLAFLFPTLLLPLFSKMLKSLKENPAEESKKQVILILKTSCSMLLSFAIVTFCFTYFYSGDIMEFLYHRPEDQSPRVLVLLFACFIAMSTIYIFSTLLTANGNLRFLNIVALGGVILNITLNFLWIPWRHAVGAAAAALVTQWLIAMAQVIAVKKFFGLDTDFSLIAKLAAFFTITFLIGFFVSRTDIFWAWGCAIIMAVAALMFFILGMLPEKTVTKQIWGTV